MLINQIPKFDPRNFQVPILKEFLQPNYRGAISAGRGLGKDFIGLACADALALIKPGSNIGYLGTSLKAVKKILFSNEDKTGKPMYTKVMHTETLVLTRSGDPLHKDMSNFKYKNGSNIFLLGTDQDHELGTSLDALIITEGARFVFDKWKFLRGNINRANGRIVIISTPYFGSEFNDLLDGVHRESGAWNIHKVPADKALNFDGTRVYTEKELERIKKEFDEASFLQEYMCDTKAMNQESVLGESFKKGLRTSPKFDGQYKKMYFSFDLGNSDYTVMYTWYEDEINTKPVLIEQMIQRKTNLEDFINKAKETVLRYKVQNRNVNVILPFDSDNDLQGYQGKLNRRKEVEKNVSPEWNIALISKMNIIRVLQICRRVIETQRISVIDNDTGDLIIKALSSVNYKREAKSGRLLAEVDKRSGIYEDHPIDSFKYFVSFYFKEMYSEDYDRQVTNKIKSESFSFGNFNKNNYNISRPVNNFNF